MRFDISTKLKFNENFVTLKLLLQEVGKMGEQYGEERIASCMRGCHICNEVWTATVGEIICCTRKTGNFVDRYAACVFKDDLLCV